MMKISPGIRSGAVALALWLAVGGAARAGERATPEPVRVGLIGSLFRDLPESTVLNMMQPLGSLMETQTGVGGQLIPGGDAESLGRALAEDKVQLGIFHGFEFAWARQKHPQLKPLVIAVNQKQHLHAHLVVRADSPATCLGDLRGKVFALPKGTREHCHLFVNRRCAESGCGPKAHFARVSAPVNIEEALDDVVDNIAQGTVADGVSLEAFARRKPGRFAKLKTIQLSETFPAAVVAYKPGTLDEETLRKFRHGMANAKQTLLGRQMLTLWKLTGFEPVPADYEENLANIAKCYPPPENGAK